MKDLLLKLNACNDAIGWTAEKDFETAWKTCERGDWMLWLAFRLKIDIKILTLAKAKCAETVTHLMKDERSVNAVKIAIKFGEGTATLAELNTAAAAADAYVYAAAAAAAAYAAYAAAYAAYAAAYADAYADAAAYAADAAAYADTYAYAYAYAAATRKESLKVSADICRKYISIEMLKENYEDF